MSANAAQNRSARTARCPRSSGCLGPLLRAELLREREQDRRGARRGGGDAVSANSRSLPREVRRHVAGPFRRAVSSISRRSQPKPRSPQSRRQPNMRTRSSGSRGIRRGSGARRSASARISAQLLRGRSRTPRSAHSSAPSGRASAGVARGRTDRARVGDLLHVEAVASGLAEGARDARAQHEPEAGHLPRSVDLDVVGHGVTMPQNAG